MGILEEFVGADTHGEDYWKHATRYQCISKAITSFESNDLDGSELTSQCT